jgi:uncharacterized protein (DUF433 family)
MSTQHPRITIDPQRRGGRPCVRDLRISVGDVLGWLAAGQTPDLVVAEYSELTLDDVRACLAYAAEREARGPEGMANSQLRDDGIEIRAMPCNLRMGWADDARRLSTSGGDTLVWPQC